MNDWEYRAWLIELDALRCWADREPTPLEAIEDGMIALANAVAEAGVPLMEAAANIAAVFSGWQG